MKSASIIEQHPLISTNSKSISATKTAELSEEKNCLFKKPAIADFSFSQQPVYNNSTEFPLGLQPKLSINEPGDKYEQEADAMAEKIMRMEIPDVQTKSLPISVIQRKCAHCEEEEKKKLQRKEISFIQRQHTGIEKPPVRKGEVSDVVEAVTQIPFVSNFLTRIGDDFKLHLENTWNASLPNKVGIIGGGLSLSAGLGLAVYAARNNPKALDLMMSPLSGTVIAPFNSETFPSLVRSFAFEVNFDSNEGHTIRNIMGGVHFDVGRLLPTGWGFGPVQERSAIGAPWDTSVHRKTTEAEKTQAVNTNQLNSYVGNLPGRGKPLSTELRSFYEPRFGYDFSKVRIHDDDAATQSAQSINALAYTHGNNIVFNSGQYAPESNIGKRLLGHELTHVVQQNLSRRNIYPFIQREMKFELQTKNYIWRNDGITASKLDRKYGPKDFLVKGASGVRLESESYGVLEFETKWEKTWSKLKAQLVEAEAMTKTMNAAPVAVNGRRSFPFNVDHLRTGTKVEMKSGFWKPVKDYEGSKEKILKSNENLEVEIGNHNWDAGIQSSEGIFLNQYESLLKDYEYRDYKDPTIASANNLLTTANYKKVNASKLINLLNFLEIIIDYIMRGEGGAKSDTNGAYSDVKGKASKQAFTLMNRTNFASIYRVLLSSTEKKIFQRIVNKKLLLNEMGLTTKTPFFVKGYGITSHHKGPTVHEWLSGILKGEDKLAAHKAGISSAMGKFEVETKANKNDSNLIKFEIRNMPSGAWRKASGWVSFAENMFLRAANCRSRPGHSSNLKYDGSKTFTGTC